MDNKLQQALGQVRLPQEARARVLENLSQRRRPRRRAARWAVAACALMAFLLGGGGWAYFTPTAYVAVESATPCELAVNRFGAVVAVEPAGQARLWQSYQDALGQLLEEEEGPRSVTVAGEGVQCQEIRQQVEDCHNVACHAMSLEDREAAQAAGLSPGRYRVYEEIAALDPAFTQQEAAGMSMAQLREKLRSLTEGDAAEPAASPQASPAPQNTASPGGRHGQGQGSGQGQSSGQGKRHGRN